MAYAIRPGRLRRLRRPHERPADGPRHADGLHGRVACGGFSYGDTLGAGEGWAQTIRFNPHLADQFAAFFGRTDTFALGICNGCQMMSSLASMIPGAEAWPKFTRNKSEQFEARFSLVEVQSSPSIFFAGMAGTRMPIAVAHGEGFADFSQRGDAAKVAVAMRFVDHHGQATERYPFNPNGSAGRPHVGDDADGRFTVLMPHAGARVPQRADELDAGRVDSTTQARGCACSRTRGAGWADASRRRFTGRRSKANCRAQ